MVHLEENWWQLALLSMGMAAVHAWFPAIDTRVQRNESVWMGVIGGVAACYVTLYLLPKLGLIMAGNGDTRYKAVGFFNLGMYYVLLLSMVSYLIMLHADGHRVSEKLSRLFDYAVHGSYAFLVGYVFVELSSPKMLVNVLIACVLAGHLLGMNHLLRSVRRVGYDRIVRWVCCALLVCGTSIGLITEIPRPIINTITAFLAGIILVNVIAEELPLRDANRLPWFVIGIALYLGATYLMVTIEDGA